MDLAVYGAQGYALGAYEALKALYPRRHVRCFLVSSMGGNAPILGGLPVLELPVFSEGLSLAEKEDLEVLICTPEDVQAEIEEMLENHGFRHYSRLDSRRWAVLVGMFHARLGRFIPLSALPMGCRRPFVRVFMARSHRDKRLEGQLALPGYVLPVQVGADLCGETIANLKDNVKEGISYKNGNYSELTGLYWVWRNRLLPRGDAEGEGRQYFGLSQYRRMLELSEEDLLRLSDNDVDVVLPYPMPYEPDIHAHHKRYLKDADWNALLTALKELQPGYAEAFPAILGQQYLYNYNVILARKEVLRAYCEWLFPILARAEELSEPKGRDRADRYIGYMGETLETLYFMKNADRLSIVHTGCRLLT